MDEVLKGRELVAEIFATAKASREKMSDVDMVGSGEEMRDVNKVGPLGRSTWVGRSISFSQVVQHVASCIATGLRLKLQLACVIITLYVAAL